MSNPTKPIDERRSEEILTLWANLTDDLFLDKQRFLRRVRVARYADVFQDPFGREIAGSEIEWALGVREYLRAAWDAPDHRTRKWYIFKLRDLYARVSM